MNIIFNTKELVMLYTELSEKEFDKCHTPIIDTGLGNGETGIFVLEIGIMGTSFPKNNGWQKISRRKCIEFFHDALKVCIESVLTNNLLDSDHMAQTLDAFGETCSAEQRELLKSCYVYTDGFTRFGTHETVSTVEGIDFYIDALDKLLDKR